MSEKTAADYADKRGFSISKNQSASIRGALTRGKKVIRGLFAPHFFSWRLNILSMRSVIMNPPTTLIVEATTAMKPSVVLRVPRSAPAATSEPTSEMPEMAFVADIKRRVQQRRHAGDDLVAEEAGQQEDVHLQEGKCVGRA